MCARARSVLAFAFHFCAFTPLPPPPCPLAVVVGADRVVANGDTANKVGTYQLAIAAKHHGVPFYVAAPSTSCDLSLESGKDIIIEVRPPEELTSINGVPIAAPGEPVLHGGLEERPGLCDVTAAVQRWSSFV